MTALSLLGTALKDDAVIEILEQYDVDVVYDFDRLHENCPDVYWAGIKAAGLQLRFNEQQLLDTVFCYVEPREGFDAALTEEIGVPVFRSYDEAEQQCKLSGTKCQTSGASKSWLKAHGPGYDAHYEFASGRISMVTLMLRRDDA